MLKLSKNDRILVLAPHPDDETIGTSGILQEALRLNVPAKIVYFTNGDNNEASFIVYEKHLVFRRKEFIYMGEVRRKEASAAMELLGIDKKELTFLGYPDFGTMHIFKEHWGNTPAFKSMLTRVTRVPYPECLSQGAPYSGESILNDLKTILINFKPTKIFSPNPVDLNVDHRSLFLFLQVALWDLENQITRPQVYPYLVHALHWPKPRGLWPALDQTLPEAMTSDDIGLQEFNLTDSMVNKKREMISRYRSQIEYSPHFLYSFARKKELFFNYPGISLDKPHSIKGHAYEEKNIEDKHIRSLNFGKENHSLFIQINLHKLITKERGISIYLFGYKKSSSFTQMPKILLHIGWRSKMYIYNRRALLQIKEAKFNLNKEGKEITIQFPLSCLDYPDYILSSAETHTKDLSLETTAWRTLLV